MEPPKNRPFTFHGLYAKKAEYKTPLPFGPEEVAPYTSPPEGWDLTDWIRFYLRQEVYGGDRANSYQAKRYDLHKFHAYFTHTFPGQDILSWDKAFTGIFKEAIKPEYDLDTLYRVMATVVNFANFVVQWGVFPPQANPGRHIKLPRREPPPFEAIQIVPAGPSVRDKSPSIPRGDIYGMFMDACEDLIAQKPSWPAHLRDRALPLRDRAIIWLLFNTGIRVTEVCRLRTKQRGPAKGSEGAWFHKVQCKGNVTRDIYIPEEGTEFMDLYISQERAATLTKWGEKLTVPPLQVFLSWRGKKLDRAAVWSIVQKVSRRASVYLPPGFIFYAHPHSFRHERGYLLKESGMSDSDIAEQLGHSDLSQVARYTQASKKEKEALLEGIKYKRGQ